MGSHDENINPAASYRVLLAEDNLINRTVIRDMLEHRGYLVTTVEDGAEAVSAYRNQAAFDVVFMDVQMPNLDGLAATRAIRAIESSEFRAPVPIIALTANAMTQDKTACEASGMNAHIAKPIRWSDLFATCDRLVAAAKLQ